MNLKIIVLGTAFSFREITQFCSTLAIEWREIKSREFLYRYAIHSIDEQNQLEIYEYGTSSFRFDHMWEILAEGVIGFIFIFDSSNPQMFSDSLGRLETFSAYCPTPCIIATINQDKEDAWDVEALRILLRIPPEIPIIPCVATDKKSVANVLIALCEEVLREIEEDEAEM